MNGANIESLPTVKQRLEMKKSMKNTPDEELPHVEGTGLFVIQSCINHSCEPNAEIVGGLRDAKDARIKVTSCYNIS